MRGMVITFAALLALSMYALGNMADEAQAAEHSGLMSKSKAHALECVENYTPEDCN